MKISTYLVLWSALSIFSIETAIARQYIQTPDIRIGHLPETVVINGKTSVSYELHLINFAETTVEITGLTIIEEISGEEVFSVTGNDLKTFINTWEEPVEGLLPPGTASVIYIDFILPDELRSKKLLHHFYFAISDGKTKNSTLVSGPVIDLWETALVLGPPLRGGPWAAIYEPAWERGHRRVFYTVDGKARIPGRFAIDFIKLDNVGGVAEGDIDTVSNYYGYGAEVLAVADGIVASVRNDFPESLTLSGHPRYQADKATGNYVSIGIGNDRYVFYEHLKPGSIRVEPGQKVTKGEVIASLGFTGQATMPHLHFHVADTDSPLGAEGIPFLFEDFSLIGEYQDFTRFSKEPWTPIKDKTSSGITRERPGPNTVIRFFP